MILKEIAVKEKHIKSNRIEIANYIEELLYLHHSVVIPGFGGFVSSYRPANIDHVQGLLHPPSKYLYFNNNLLVDDGVLINYIRGRHQLSKSEAISTIAAFVKETNKDLESREIILFPGVGRLYKNYEGKLQFLQDNTNFNTDTFGLPAVHFYPVLRNKEKAPNEAPIPHEGSARVMESEASRVVEVLQASLPTLAGLAMIAFGLTFYMFQIQQNSIAEMTAQRIPVSERFNKAPSDLNQSAIGLVNSDKSTTSLEPEESEEEFIDFEEEEPSAFDTESITLGPNQKEGIIIVGAYAYPYARKRMIERIIELGYDVYQEPLKNSTRVGVQFIYEDRAELNRVIKIIRENLDHRAWILDKKKY